MSHRFESVHLEGNDPKWNMPYVPAIKVTGGSMVFVSGVTAAPAAGLRDGAGAAPRGGPPGRPHRGPPAAGPRLSALVVARNEAAQLGDCLATLRFADEIVVVLDRTEDASAAIAREHGARVVEGAWEIEGERRNAGLDACAGDWILEVDADERIPPALAEEIRRVIAASPHGWHEIPVDNYVGGRLVRHGWGGSFGTTRVPRLSRRGAKRWWAQRVHPGADWRGEQGPALTRPLVHHVDRDISDMLRRLDRYTDARAADLLAADDVGTTARNIRRFFSRFWKCYVARKGYREGGWGVLIALCAGLYPLLSHLKAKLEPERHGGARAGDPGRRDRSPPRDRAA